MSSYKNIIWIVMDGVRNYPTPQDPERMGKPDIVDRVAEDAVEFTQAICSATSTTMSITSMMTGIPSYYLSRNLEDINLNKRYSSTLGSILEQHNYAVYNISYYYEMRRDYWKPLLRPVDPKYWPNGCKATVHWNNEPLNKIIFKLLNEGLSEPFFLFVHYNFRRDYECNDKVSAFINRLKKEGLYDDCVIVMCSDHGMPDPQRRDHYKWLQERGLYFNRHDLVMTDDNICVPLVLKYPGCPASKKIETIVGLIDVTPTLLDITHVATDADGPSETQFRGLSLLPLIEGKDQALFQTRKIRTDTRYLCQSDRMISIRGSDAKYIYLRDIPTEEKEQFYDIKNDPLETNNLIDVKDSNTKEKIEQYRAEYRRQEQDAVCYQKELLSKKFRTDLSRISNGREIKKILLFGSSNPYAFELFYDIITQAIPSSQIDLLLERDNSLSNEEIVRIGFRNIIFLPSRFHHDEFKASFRDVFESYDLSLIPVTDFRKDRAQAESKSTNGKMVIMGPQAPIDNWLLADYKEIFRVAQQIRAHKTMYINYNMDVFKHPRLHLARKYLSKVAAKKDIYVNRPAEFLRDLRRIVN